MNRFRKKSETRRPQALEDPRLSDFSRSPSVSTTNSGFLISGNKGGNSTPISATSSAAPPALPALSTGSEFRTSLIFPDLTRSFQQTGRPAHIPEAKIRSKLAQQRLRGIHEERITEEEEDLMFAALTSIQGIRRARGNSSASANNSTISSGNTSVNMSTGDASVELLYPESVGSGGSSRSPGMSSAGLIGSFPDTPAVGGDVEGAGSTATSTSGSIYPFASLSPQSSQNSNAASRRHSNNLFSSSRFRDASYMKGIQRNRTISGSTNTTNASNSTVAIAISPDIFEESSSPSPSPSPSPIEPTSNASTSYVAHQQYGHGHLSDKEKTPVARSTRLPLPQPPVAASSPRVVNGTTLTAAQLRRISVALDRAISAIVENDHEADDDEERILAPHSVPLGGGYPARIRPPTAFNDPSNPIEVSDLNAVLMYLENSRQSQSQSIHSLTHARESSTSSPVPVSSTPTPGYVPGMNRPISPRDMPNSGHDSEDYSTTPRATSPVTSFNRGNVLVPRRQQSNNGGSNSNSGRPSTAPTRIGMGMGSNAGAGAGDWRGQYQPQGDVGDVSNNAGGGLERSYSIGQAYDRRFQSQAGDFSSNSISHRVTTGYTHRRRPSSPLAHEHFMATSLVSDMNGTNTSLTGAAAALSRSAGSATSASTSTDSGSDTQVNPVRPVGTQSNGNAQNAPEPSGSEADHGQDIVNGQGLSRETSLTRSMTGPSLPDSPMIDEDPFRNYFPIPATHNWALNLERQASGTPTSTASVGGIIMPQPTQRTPAPASSVPVIARSQTPNNIARTITPVATSISIAAGIVQTSPVARVGTPNYLVQRSPSANGFHMDHNHDHSTVAQESAVRRTLSHTPSTSSTSAYNPMLHSSLGSSSRSSTGSAGSSYHSSDEGDAYFREVSNWLFDPESKGSTFVSGKRKSGVNGDGDDSSRDELDSKDDASDSVGDQEDVLQLLTGLTKRDLSSIQQKLVSAAVAREAEEAIRQSQRRRRPSVQSREFVGSSTPKPQMTTTTTTTQAEPVIIQRVTSPAPVVINRIQSPTPETRPETENIVPPEVLPEPPMIIARPQSPVEEPTVVYTITEEFEVPSAATTPPQTEAQISISPPVDQSPRARALAEALFGGETTSPAVSPPRINRSAEELHDEVGRKVLAATTALKSPSLTVEGGLPLRRKSTKRIDLQKISGPHLVSASMSVDAIPLASPSMTSLGVVASPQDGAKRGSGIGSRLRRLGGSLRTKTNTVGHERENSGGNVVQEPTSSGLSQVVDYDPQGLQPPQIKSVPPHSGGSVKGAVGFPGPITPPATAGPAGLKGFMSRLRRPGGGSIRRGETSPGRPAVSMQPSALLSSTHLNENEPALPINQTQPPVVHALARALPSDSLPIPSVSTQTPDETSLKQLFDAANNLGLDPAALNELLSNRAALQQASKAAPWMAPTDSRSGTSTQRYDDSSSSPRTTAQTSAAVSRQASTRVKIEAAPRLRPAREGGNPQSAVVRRTIIYPATAGTSASPLPGQGRSTGVQRKASAASSSNKRRPISFQSQYSGKSVHDRTPTPPPPRGAAAKRMSQDGLPPMPGSMFSSSARPGTSAGIINDGCGDRQSFELQEGSPDLSNLEDGRALQVVELENGEVIWSVLDSLRAPGDDLDDDVRSNYFSDRGSYASHYSAADDPTQVSFKGPVHSTSRAGTTPNNGSQRGVPDRSGAETKVFYSDAKEIARLISQITNAADYGQFNINPGTPSTRSSEDLPVEDQLERLMQRLAETR